MFLLLFVFIFNSFSCEITLFKTNFITGNTHNFVDETNCSDELVTKINKKLNEQIGSIDVSSILNKNDEISIRPETIQISNISDVVKEYLSLNQNERIIDFKFIGQNPFALQLNNECVPQFECPNCNSGINNQLKLQCDNLNFWGTFEIEEYIDVFKIKNNILPFTAISIENIGKNLEWVNKKKNNYYVGEIEQLRFFKSNKMLKQGQILNTEDITSINLIQSNQHVNVQFNNSGIKISTEGISQKSGHYGDYITVKNTKTNKIFNAKVIDYQTVEVNL